MSSFDDEYALFKSEIDNLDTTTDANDRGNEEENAEKDVVPTEPVSVELPDIESELNYLKGHKCQAPYYNRNADDTEQVQSNASYHNALVMSVHTPEDGVADINEIHVKVVFTHPVYRAMLPCPYYLDGDCKYSEERCFFSHGYLVKFIELKEYKNVNYDNLHLNQLVLAKNLQTKIWYRAKIVDFNTKEDTVFVQFETGEGRKGLAKGDQNRVEMELEDIYPLESDEASALEVESMTDDESDDKATFDQMEAIEMSLNRTPLDKRLGDWEKHTKGMGSKLMMKMGYIIGTGLGKNCKGRIEPVETLVLPQGKSLDYCMNLKEKYGGGSEDMFKMEKINQRMERKIAKQNKKNYENAVKKEKTDVFSFLNRNLNHGNSSNEQTEKSNSSNSNVEKFKISERINKHKKQLVELGKRLKRHEPGSDMYKKIDREISIVNGQISSLNKQENNIQDQEKKQFNKKAMMKF